MLVERATGNSRGQFTKWNFHWSWFLQNFAETSSEIFPIFLDSTTKSFSSHPFTFTIASAPPPPPPLMFFSVFVFWVFFALFFHLLSSLSLTLISIIYCLSTSLLLHLVTTHLLSHLFLHPIFHYFCANCRHLLYCLNYTSLLLHLILMHLVINFIITM